MFVSLKHRDFRIFWTGQCVSLLGTWMQRTALMWLVYTMTDSPFLVGLVGVAQFMPMLLFTLFAGAIVDRFPKRKIIIVTQSLLMVQAVALAALAFSGSAEYWQLLTLCVFLGITTTIDVPARLSFFVYLVGKDDVMNAVSLNSSIVNLARIVGPALAGAVMMEFGAGVCFMLNAVSFLAVLYSLTRLRTQEPRALPRAKKRSVVKEVFEGLDYIRHDQTLSINATILAVVCTFALNGEVMAPVFADTVLEMGAGAYTGMLSAMGAGSLAGAITMASLAKRGEKKWLLPAGAAATLLMITMASLAKRGEKKWLLPAGAAATLLMHLLMLFAWSRGAAYLLVAAIGYFNLVFLNAGNSIFQVHTPDEYRGRVMSVYTFLSQGSLPLGNFFAGSVMQSFGGWAGYPSCGLAAALLLFLFLRKKRETLRSWFVQGGVLRG